MEKSQAQLFFFLGSMDVGIALGMLSNARWHWFVYYVGLACLMFVWRHRIVNKEKSV